MFGAGPVTYVVQPAATPIRWRDRPWVWVAAVALILLAVSFSLAPWFAYRAVRSAARYDDAAALAQLVDYDAVRASLKPQLIDPQGAPAAPPPPNPLSNPIAALQNAWANRSWSSAARQAPSPDAYLSPSALSQVLAGAAQPKQPPSPASTRPATPWPSLAFFGLHRVRFVVRDPKDARRETVLVFVRDKGWFDWRLAGLVLPQPGSVP